MIFEVRSICPANQSWSSRKKLAKAHPELFPFRVRVGGDPVLCRCGNPGYIVGKISAISVEKRFGFEHDDRPRRVCLSMGDFV